MVKKKLPKTFWMIKTPTNEEILMCMTTSWSVDVCICNSMSERGVTQYSCTVSVEPISVCV